MTNYSVCPSPKRILSIAVIFFSLLLGTRSNAAEQCPTDRSFCTAFYCDTHECYCPAGYVKEYAAGFFDGLASCRPVYCPVGEWFCTSPVLCTQYHDCKCSVGYKKRYKNIGDVFGICAHEICPLGVEFSTGKEYYECECPAGTEKVITGVSKADMPRTCT